MELRLF